MRLSGYADNLFSYVGLVLDKGQSNAEVKHQAAEGLGQHSLYSSEHIFHFGMGDNAGQENEPSSNDEYEFEAVENLTK